MRKKCKEFNFFLKDKYTNHRKNAVKCLVFLNVRLNYGFRQCRLKDNRTCHVFIAVSCLSCVKNHYRVKMISLTNLHYRKFMVDFKKIFYFHN